MTAPYTLSDFDFELPPELIAQQPAAERSSSRLLDGRAAVAVDRIFRELPGLLRAGDLLVINDTRVIKARLLGAKASGGAVEALVERVLGDHVVLAHVRASKSPKPGSTIRFTKVATEASGAIDAAGASLAETGFDGSHDGASADAFDAEVLGRDGPDGSLFRLRFPADPFTLLERHGHVPLPPYIAHADGAADERRYQTVFADRAGAVAAPTAALHFDAALLDALREHGVGLARVTLHVGAGTFQPVRTENLAAHTMHSEWYEVGEDTVAAIERAQANGGRVVAVGTTTLRALESAARVAGLKPGRGETDIFITPGFSFEVVDLLITNFHLPKSTLMMLVSAFAGHAHVMALYRHAIASRYRFFSYGDAMLLEREATIPPCPPSTC